MSIRFDILLLACCLCLGASGAPLKADEYEAIDPELAGDYFQGDMDVELTRNGELAVTRHWPNATVYYKIDEQFSRFRNCCMRFSSLNQQRLRRCCTNATY